jgi:hypothetical protein
MNRREFMLSGLATASAAMAGPLSAIAAAGPVPSEPQPWYRRVRRWSQINLTEDDPVNFDAGFWRQYWKQTRTQGVLLNAGGDVCFYPSALPGQRRAQFLGDRDFFGELVKACRADGLNVMARLAYRGSAEMMTAHPEWLCLDVSGKPQKRFCMNGGFFYQHCAAIQREVGERYRPDGYTVSGWGVNYALCYCAVCTRLFKEKTGLELPRKRDWDDPVYQTWHEWNASQVMALWDDQNRIARETVGPDCIWVGQIVGSMASRGLKDIADRSPMMMIDYQKRDDESGFQDGTTAGKVFNGLMNWSKPVTQAIGIYSGMRLMSSPAPEWTTWMRQTIAGGVLPWWHTVSSYSEDKRRFEAVPALMQWHERNARYLFDRTPVATVGVVWSDTNNVFFGREQAFERVVDPWMGMTHALIRARIPFVAVHADHIDRDAAQLRTLILPNLAAMSDEHLASVQRFVARGGNLFATGESSLYDRFGKPRDDYALAALFGAHRTAGSPLGIQQSFALSPARTAAIMAYLADVSEISGLPLPQAPRQRGVILEQTYMRLLPGLRRSLPGPHHAAEPAVPPGTVRHPVLRGLDKTDLVIFGGTLHPLRLDSSATALLTFIPPIQANPPESAWLRTPETDIPGLLVNSLPNGSRIVFMPADLDRRYSTARIPDHAELLANAVRWTTSNDLPLFVEGPGLLDCNLYRQPDRLILHIGNLSGMHGHGIVEEILPVGPVKVKVRIDGDVRGTRARSLVSESRLTVKRKEGWAEVTLPSIEAHEVIVVE